MTENAARVPWARASWRAVAPIVLSVSLLGCAADVSVAPDRSVASSSGPATLDAQRGGLLYDAHCVACHTAQAHWRDNSIVGTWGDVLVQVARWQTNAGQQWDSQEIGDVAAYLNAVYYKKACAVTGCQGSDNAALTQTLIVAQDD